jgi:hypothetical protein
MEIHTDFTHLKHKIARVVGYYLVVVETKASAATKY